MSRRFYVVSIAVPQTSIASLYVGPKTRSVPIREWLDRRIVQTRDSHSTNLEMRTSLQQMKTFLLSIQLVMALLGLAACTDSGTAEPPASLTEEELDLQSRGTLLDVPARYFRSLSVHPNNKELLFLESIDGRTETYKLMRFHLETGKLQHYALSNKHDYRSAEFSPSGKFIVLWRFPAVGGDWLAQREASKKSELVILNTDGSGINFIAISEGLKQLPAMSHDDRYVAYWRGEIYPGRGSSYSRSNDVWEVDLLTGEDRLFASKSYFAVAGRLQYFKEDGRLLVSCESPMAYLVPLSEEADSYGYLKRTARIIFDPPTPPFENLTGTRVFAFTRGEKDLPIPHVLNAFSPSYASLSNSQDLYYVDYDFKRYKLTKHANAEAHPAWQFPLIQINRLHSPVVFPNNKHLGFIFVYQGAEERSRGIGLFNLKNNTWRQLDIPTLEESTPIEIRMKNF